MSSDSGKTLAVLMEIAAVVQLAQLFWQRNLKKNLTINNKHSDLLHARGARERSAVPEGLAVSLGVIWEHSLPRHLQTIFRCSHKNHNEASTLFCLIYGCFSGMRPMHGSD